MQLVKILSVSLSVLYLTACNTNTKKEETQEIPITETLSDSTVTAPEPEIDPKVIEAEQYTLAPGQAGLIRINMYSDSLKRIIPKENLKTVQRELEGVPYNAYELRNSQNGDQLLLLAEESCANQVCTIFRTRVLSPKFKTEKGIRVGSTFAEVKNAYPLSFVGMGETDFVAISEENKMSFTLDISNFPPKHLDRISPSEVPDSTHVTSILLF